MFLEVSHFPINRKQQVENTEALPPVRQGGSARASAILAVLAARSINVLS
jgi:hypothetical protein